MPAKALGEVFSASLDFGNAAARNWNRYVNPAQSWTGYNPPGTWCKRQGEGLFHGTGPSGVTGQFHRSKSDNPAYV
ncbi:MAG: hypothetical protein AMXMBFR7_47980 [Planctomycetota bacterium]